MNPMTMIFAVLLIVILLEAPSSEAATYRICRTRHLVEAYVRICPRRKRAVTIVEGPSKSELTKKKTSSAADEWDSVAAHLLRKRWSDVHWTEEEEKQEQLTDYEPISSTGDGLVSRGTKSGERSRRSVTRKGRVYTLLKLCCFKGCTDDDIKKGMCAVEADPVD